MKNCIMQFKSGGSNHFIFQHHFLFFYHRSKFLHIAVICVWWNCWLVVKSKWYVFDSVKRKSVLLVVLSIVVINLLEINIWNWFGIELCLQTFDYLNYLWNKMFQKMFTFFEFKCLHFWIMLTDLWIIF